MFRIKGVLSAIIAVCVLFSCFPVFASANAEAAAITIPEDIMKEIRKRAEPESIEDLYLLAAELIASVIRQPDPALDSYAENLYLDLYGYSRTGECEIYIQDYSQLFGSEMIIVTPHYCYLFSYSSNLEASIDMEKSSLIDTSGIADVSPQTDAYGKEIHIRKLDPDALISIINYIIK